MFKNYLTTALRILRRHPGYAFINVFGLGLGLAVMLLLALYVRHEVTYDRFHADADRIVRVWLEEKYEGEHFVNVHTPLPLADRLVTDFPEVEQAVRIYAYTDLVRRGPVQFAERIHLTSSAFFEVFSFPLRRGDPATALTDPHSVVLTEPLAQKYFGGEDPLGHTLEVRVGSEVQAFTVTGVAEAPPTNSSIQFDLLIPFVQSLGAFREQSWQAWQQVYPETYALLRDDATAAALEAKLPDLARSALGDNYEEGAYTFHLQPLTAIHLDSSLPAGLEPTSDPAYPAVLGGIALLVLLIACVNFMTLAVSRSTQRAKEVGVRKAMGAQRSQLMRQFWGEAAIVVVAALVLGAVLSLVALPFFNQLAGTALRFRLEPTLLLFALGLVTTVAFVAGSYPAVVLARFRPVEVLRNRVGGRGDRGLLRRSLVTLQFALATFLIAGTLVMTRQLNYLRDKPLGFQRDRIVLVPTTGRFRDGLAVYERLRTALAGEPAFAGVTASAFGFDEGWAGIGYDADDGTYREFAANFAGYDFVETMGMEMLAGHTFDRDNPADTSRGLLVNETFAREYGWTPGEAVGKRLPGPFPDHEIIGVVRDFHYETLHAPIEPLAVVANPNLVLRGASNVNFAGQADVDLAVRLAPGDAHVALGRLEQIWKQIAPEQPFDFTFLDSALDAQYRQEIRMQQIVTVAAGLAILIACLGLFGLAAFAAAQRTKEIGIRKVLGAGETQVAALLARDFLALVLIGFVVAAPLAYVAGDRWLDSFAYRVDLGFGVFLLAGSLSVLIALATVSYHAIRAALADPVQSLRYE